MSIRARLQRLEAEAGGGELFDGMTLADGIRAGFWDRDADVPEAVERQRLMIVLAGAPRLLIGDHPELAASTRKRLGFGPDEEIDPADLTRRCLAVAERAGFNDAELERLEEHVSRPAARFPYTQEECAAWASQRG